MPPFLLSTFLLLLRCDGPLLVHGQQTQQWTLTDTHIHAIPPAYAAALSKAGGDPSGYATPEWSIEGTLESLKLTHSDRAVLSISTPGVPIAGTGEEARNLCREVNNYLANLVKDHPGQLDFFGALPDWRDVNGTLYEIDFLFSSQKAVIGVGMYTSYGELLPGDPSFQPVWEKLESYKALVFMHPGVMDVTPKLIDRFLPQPIIDYPQQTTRAAVDLVFSGVRSSTPNIDLILSHAGGTLPYLVQRATGSLAIPDIAKHSSVQAAEATKQFQRFYYDTALSTSATQLSGLLLSVDPSQVLMGSDYPYAPAAAIKAGFEEYIGFVRDHPELGPDTLTENAKRLILKHSGKYE